MRRVIITQDLRYGSSDHVPAAVSVVEVVAEGVEVVAESVIVVAKAAVLLVMIGELIAELASSDAAAVAV